VWCSDRRGGTSLAPYDSLNVGDHVGDEPGAVAANRARLAAALGLPPADRWAWMEQVHGADVAVVDAPTATPPVADALVTATPDLPLAVVTADCAPIALACDGAIGVVHAGHRGLLAGVIERAVTALRSLGRGEVRALLGPCIRAPRYEFGARDLEPLVASFGSRVESRTEWGTPAFDITEAVRVALRRAGVDHLDDTTTCTSESRDYFSYRRDGVTGRQATIAVLS
jgi:purine-nucleoside/S-methyl-5'-thioadenosine phosphorylase / adenosine deaminase